MEALEITDYKSVITECFSTDTDLIEKWHIESGSNLETCANRTFNDLQDIDVNFYKLMINNSVVGFFGIEDNKFLTGFFLKPEIRKSKHIQDFWNIVDSKFSDSYMIGIFKKNERAKEFLLKKTDIFFENNQAVYFVVNRGI